MKWFQECASLDEVKAMYKKLAKQYHPDLGGDTEMMQQINLEFREASAKVINGSGLTEEEATEKIRFSEEYRQAIEKVIHLEGITIEVIHKWIWVTGQTRKHKDTLKAAGYFFASKKQAWYFRTDEYKVKKGGKKDLDEIRAKYGSEIVYSRKWSDKRYLHQK